MPVGRLFSSGSSVVPLNVVVTPLAFLESLARDVLTEVSESNREGRRLAEALSAKGNSNYFHDHIDHSDGKLT